MGVEIAVPLSLFLMVVLIVFVAVNGSVQKRRATLKTIEEAIRNGQQMTPDLIRALGMPRKNAGGDVKSGAILIAVALALIVFGWMVSAIDGGSEAYEAQMVFLGFAAFPGFIGVVLMGFGLLSKNKPEEQA